MKRVLTLGVYDGVHRGHLHIIRKVIRRARQIRGTSMVYTFEPHPVRILVPENCPPMIMTPQQKKGALHEAGVQKVIIQKFTHRFSQISPEDFFHRILIRKLKASELFVGYDFTFGYHRGGTIESLEAMGKEAGVRVTVVGPFLWKEVLVSSTQIRQLLIKGQLRAATELLGKPYRMTGKVIKGRGIGGKKLGVHTANLKPENEQILPTGVYATYTVMNKRHYPSVTNIGPNPTFGPGKLSVETHLLNFNQRIVGRQIDVEFLEKIREEITFSSPQELAAQIQNDIRTAKRCHR